MKTREEQIDDVRSKIFQAIGQSSMCWQNICSAGIYQSDEAIAIGEDLITYLFANFELKEKPEE